MSKVILLLVTLLISSTMNVYIKFPGTVHAVISIQGLFPVLEKNA